MKANLLPEADFFRIFMWLAVCVHITSMAAAQSPEARIMPLGDSITRGTNDINHPNGSIPGGYRKELGTRLTNGGFAYDFVGSSIENAAAGMDPDHQGYNGWLSADALAQLPSWLSLAPDIVLLHIGTNDILNNLPVSTAAANLDTLINAITVNAPDRRLYVATIIPITQAWPPPPQTQLYSAAYLNANVNAYNVLVRNLVTQYANLGRKVYLVEMNGGVVLNNANPLLNFYQPGDGIHPGQAGYNQMGAIWADAITAAGSLFPPPLAGVPANPGSVATTVVSGTVINVTWADNSSNETNFALFRKTGYSGTWQQIATLPANTEIFSSTGLQTGENPYFFALRAVNANGSSAWSNIASAIPINVALNKPATASSAFSPATVAPKANNGNITEFWSAMEVDTNSRWDVDLAAGFRIHRVEFVTRQDSDRPAARKNFEIRASNDPAFSTYTVLTQQGDVPLTHASTLAVNTNQLTPFRYVKVAKTDSIYFSFAEVRVFGVEPPAVPAAPGSPEITWIGESEVGIAWVDQSTNEVGFKLERQTGVAGAFSEIAGLPAGATTFLDSGLSSDTPYFYRLRSTNGVDDSAYTSTVAATTQPLTAYGTWTTSYPQFLALPPAERVPAADPNKDGVANLIAFAFALDPLAPLPAGSMPVVLTAPSPSFQFRRNTTSGLTYELLLSTDLSEAGWQAQSQAGATFEAVPGEPTVERVTIPLEAGGSRKFARLRVIRN